MLSYEPPQLTRLGTLAEITQGGDPAALGDGAAFRGPATTPTDPTS